MSGSGDDEQVPLLERVEMMPSIPKEAGHDIAVLEREFVDAEVQLSMSGQREVLSVFIFYKGGSCMY